MTHDEIIAIVQAHKEGKTIEHIHYLSSHQKWVEAHCLENALIKLAFPNEYGVRIKPESKYRAWRQDEIPRIAEYRYKPNKTVMKIGQMSRNGDGEIVIRFTPDNWNWISVGTAFNSYEYRTDLAKDEWFVCGVEIEEGEQP